ncbi:MAG: hypothetical protein ATN35_01925 [Epulopiscium sp. Nele67-Bin004]|nr:MAG: hypothetical protein ATN35_01925 [Epulopiscium sp. Nele67-Bin004]
MAIIKTARWEEGLPALLGSFSESHSVKTAHFDAYCGVLAHLQLWPLFARHRGSTSCLCKACAEFHCGVQNRFYSDVSVRARKAQNYGSMDPSKYFHVALRTKPLSAKGTQT